MTFEGHFGDPLSNFLVPLNIFGTDEVIRTSNLVGKYHLASGGNYEGAKIDGPDIDGPSSRGGH